MYTTSINIYFISLKSLFRWKSPNQIQITTRNLENRLIILSLILSIMFLVLSRRPVGNSSDTMAPVPKSDSCVVNCTVDWWLWIPKPTSQFPVTISCCSQSNQCCPTDIEYNPNFTNMAAISKSRRRDQKWGKFKSGDKMDNRTSDDLHEAWKESEKTQE